MRIVDPRGSASYATAEPYSLRLPAGAARVALLSNAFPNCTQFLEFLGAKIGMIAPELEVRMYVKSTAVGPADEALTSLISAEADAVVAAYGH